MGSNVFNLAALLGLGAVVAGRISLHRRVVILEGATATWVAAVTVMVVWAAGWPASAWFWFCSAIVPYVFVLVSTSAMLAVAACP